MNRPTAIVALDVTSAARAMEIVTQLGDTCRFYKVGSELFTAAGPEIVGALRAAGADVFLDLKFHDIPNTVAGAVRSSAALGARLVTVHASGGLDMMRVAVQAAGDPDRCGILAVTVLTSLDDRSLSSAWGRERVHVADEVLRLAELAHTAGAFGLVCSGHEAPSLHARYGETLALLVPGIRPAGSAAHDQARVTTPRQAAEAGARYVVLGRAVTAAAEPRQALLEILGELG